MTDQTAQPQWSEISDPARLVREPMVSVHMLTYNHAAYLADAIQSVLDQQTAFPYELVIGEDASTDRTREIAVDFQRRYPDRIRVLYPGSNVGWRVNLRKVHESCRGKYTAFCEGDDYWHDPQKLQRQVAFLEENPDYVLVHSALNIREGDQVRFSHWKPENLPDGSLFEQLLSLNFVATCTACLRASVVARYLQTKFAAQPYAMGDYPLWLFASRQGPFLFLSEPLATYRLTPGSLMNSGFAAAQRMALSHRQVAEDFIAEYGGSDKILAEIRQLLSRRVLRGASLAGDRATFFREFHHYQQLNPGWRQDRAMRARALCLTLRMDALLRLLAKLRGF